MPHVSARVNHAPRFKWDRNATESICSGLLSYCKFPLRHTSDGFRANIMVNQGLIDFCFVTRVINRIFIVIALMVRSWCTESQHKQYHSARPCRLLFPCHFRAFHAVEQQRLQSNHTHKRIVRCMNVCVRAPVYIGPIENLPLRCSRFGFTQCAGCFRFPFFHGEFSHMPTTTWICE